MTQHRERERRGWQRFTSLTDSTETAFDRISDFSEADGDYLDLRGRRFHALSPPAA